MVAGSLRYLLNLHADVSPTTGPNLDRKPEMRDHFLHFMANMFGVYRPRKPKKIRVAFDSIAPYNGVSLNDILLTGPDLNNTLLGLIIHFRREAISFTVDTEQIEQMFYCFLVREEDRNFLWFLWFQDNDLVKDVVDSHMKVHVFGNSPSTSVAIHCLNQSFHFSDFHMDPDVKHFVM